MSTEANPGLVERLAIRAALKFEDKLKEWRDPKLIAQRSPSHLGRNIAITALAVALGFGAINTLPNLNRDPVIRGRGPAPVTGLGPEVSYPYNDLIMQNGEFELGSNANSQDTFVLKNSKSQIMFQHGIIANYAEGLEVKVDDWAVINLSRDPRIGINASPTQNAIIFLMEADDNSKTRGQQRAFIFEEYAKLNLSQQFSLTFHQPTMRVMESVPVYEVIRSVVNRLNSRSLPPEAFSEELSVAWALRMKESINPAEFNRQPNIDLNTRAVIGSQIPLTVRSISQDLIERALKPAG